MNMKAWPFLVSRNRMLDYSLIVAPQPLLEKGAATLLAEAAGGSISDPNVATYREIRSNLIGSIRLVFRVVQAEKRHIGLSENGLLKDEVGRPISLIEGIVLEGSPRDIVITKEDFQKVHKAVEAAYREFWQSTKYSPAVKSSSYFYLTGQNSTDEHMILKEEPLLDMRAYETSDNDLSLLERIYELLRRVFQKD